MFWPGFITNIRKLIIIMKIVEWISFIMRLKTGDKVSVSSTYGKGTFIKIIHLCPEQ